MTLTKMKEIPIIFWCKLSQSFDNFSKVLLERKYLLRSNQVEDIRCSKEKFYHFEGKIKWNMKDSNWNMKKVINIKIWV